ncbi:MAG: LytTR family DNA-binding domain-containing protein [Saprospiraceae bacterium]
MKPLKVIIIDDEQPGIDALIWEIENLDIPIEILATFTSPLEARSALDMLHPDILFLDIEMPILNGMDFLKTLRHISFDVIFVTAYDQYALNAYNLDVMDYLLKPVHSDRLSKTINKHLLNRKNNTLKDKMELLQQNLHPQDRFDKLAVNGKDGIVFIHFNHIVRLESSANYTLVYTLNEKHIISKPLIDVERPLLKHSFYRVHRSHTINLKYINKYIKGRTNQIIMEDKSIIPVSPEKKEEIKQLLGLG